MDELERIVRSFEQKYECDLPTFLARVTSGENYAARLRRVSPTWEGDLQEWEFYAGELNARQKGQSKWESSS